MIPKFFFVKLMIFSWIGVHCVSSRFSLIEWRYPWHQTTTTEKPKLNKPSQCYKPKQNNCSNTFMPEDGYELSWWYFNEPDKACIPLYVIPSEICPAFSHLPRSKKECEDLCGEPCTVTHADYKSEPGICMFRCPLKAPNDVNDYCPRDGVACCPREFQYPSDFWPTQAPSVKLETITFTPVLTIIGNIMNLLKNSSKAITDATSG